MKRFLPAVFILALGAPAFGQTIDSQGAAELSQNLSRYVGTQAIDKGVVAVSAEGDAYKVAIDFKPLVELIPKQEVLKFDFAPLAFLVKPRGDGEWDVSADLSLNGSFEVSGPEGPQSMQMSIKGGTFAGVYNPELAAFMSATSSMDSMTMTSRDSMQQAEITAGAGTATLSATPSAAGGVDFTTAQTSADFVEVLNLDDSESGLKLPLTIKAPKLSVDATGKGLRTKPLLDLVAFAVANGDEAKVKANQAQLKSLLLAALPLWERIDGTYAFHDFSVDSPVGTFGASELGIGFGSDGIGQNGTLSYAIKASGLTVPQDMLPAWSAAVMPTDIDLNIGGANINLHDTVKRAIEAFDLNQDPPLPDAVGAVLAADFMASLPKLVIGRSTVKSGSTEVALEGEVTFPDAKPDANLTVGVAGYDKIVESLQAAAASDPAFAQYVPAALVIKGFGKTLPDGRLEWAVNVKPDGSVLVNGVMVKPADPVGPEAAPQ